MAENDELLPIVDQQGNVIDSAPRIDCHDGISMLLHPVCHLHVFNEAGELLLQLRSKNKRIQPSKWDTAVGGHVDFGESIYQALSREAFEEAGITISEASFDLLDSYLFQSNVERELVFTFATVAPPEYTPVINEPKDIDEFRFWPITEIVGKIGSGIFTPNFEDEFERIVIPYINSRIKEK